MNLSVIVPTEGQPQRLCRLLNSFATQNLSTARYEIILVLNPVDFARSYYRDLRSFLTMLPLHVAFAKAGNRCAARNLGAQIARGEILYFLDDDCVLPHNHFLQTVVDLQKKNEAGVLTGPYLLSKEQSRLDRSYNLMSNWWYVSKHTFLAGNVSFKREAFLPFDETLMDGGEEGSLTHALALQGHYPTSLDAHGVLHCPEKTWQGLRAKAYSHSQARTPSQKTSLRPLLHNVTKSFWRQPTSALIATGYIGSVRLLSLTKTE